MYAFDTTAGAMRDEDAMLRHVVLFRFKTGSTATEIGRVVEAFRQLPARIDAIAGFEWGEDISPEGKARGYTHCFVLTFRTAEDRDAYLPHPAHQAFSALARPCLEDVCVVDYWARG